MSPFSHATALPCGAVPSLQASNFETHVECVPRPRHWGCSSRTTKPAEMLLFYPGADKQGADDDAAHQRGPEDQDEGAPRLRRETESRCGFVLLSEHATFDWRWGSGLRRREADWDADGSFDGADVVEGQGC